MVSCTCHCLGYIVSFSTLAFVAVFEVWLQVIPESIAYSVTLLAVVLLAVGCTGKDGN